MSKRRKSFKVSIKAERKTELNLITPLIKHLIKEDIVKSKKKLRALRLLSLIMTSLITWMKISERQKRASKK